jgi:YrbI family 3-deoxy-D-manno-octulosonate 8-phosphate phosphatase
MYYTARGEEGKKFSTYDGMGVARLREAGILVAVFTGETSPAVAQRMKKLNITHYFPGEKQKLTRLKQLCSRLKITLEETAYIGDDLNDCEVLNTVGLSAAPPQGPVLDIITPHYITRRAGGAGAFRDFAERILAGRDGP